MMYRSCAISTFKTPKLPINTECRLLVRSGLNSFVVLKQTTEGSLKSLEDGSAMHSTSQAFLV